MYTVEILGRQYKSPSVEFCSRTVQSVRDNLVELGEGGASQMGSRFPVRDGSGNHVADVSYNGRVWHVDGTLLSEAVA